MNKLTKQDNYQNLITNIGEVLGKGRRHAYQFINSVLAQTYWKIGRLIVEFEQKGNIKADYGSSLLKKLSKELTQKFGQGFSERNIEQMRNFYLMYGISQTLSAKFIKSSTVLRKSKSAISLKLSWSHYVRLMSIKNFDERKFYEIECVANNWSVRELNRQFDSSLYERLALSKNKRGVKKLSAKGQIVEKPTDSLKDPYVLEFLKLKEKDELVVKYTPPKDNKQIFAKEYQLYLPKKEELQKEVKRLLKN